MRGEMWRIQERQSMIFSGRSGNIGTKSFVDFDNINKKRTTYRTPFKSR